MIIWYRCVQCGQHYEAVFSTISIYAISSSKETLVVLQQCKRCGQLFQADETHSCAAVIVDFDEATLYTEAPLRLWTLGGYRLEFRNEQRQWQALDVPVERESARILLHCLVSSPGRMLFREQIIKSLWPDLDARMANERLEKTASDLEDLLEPGRSQTASSSVLLVEHAILLADQSQLWVDADAFESLLNQARESLDPGQSEHLLEEAMRFYRSDYLPQERNTPWVQTRREALQRSWIGLLLELADLRIRRKSASEAIATLDQLLAVDPTSEAAVQRLIVLLAQTGQREQAQVVYERFAATLKQAYKIAPLKETRELLRRSS